MSRKPQAASNKTSHPAVGTFIDRNSLELVEILGIGGYGVVYRAVDAYSTQPRSYAVKCLPAGHGPSSSRRQLHIREITLHQIASAHPNIVTLHRVVEEADHTFIIMDYAADGDLFTQILHKCRYLGQSAFIKHVFLQIIDAVQYCHSLGIYHRDLKPENVLCFDQGYRVAITDFGLATTDKSSKEFRTGSLYHMSPECQSADSVSGAAYSPMHNDIWSLGIILLNLTTGRNPWKSATRDDPTYQAYRRDTSHFLPSVLPISEELNSILVRTLKVDWRARTSLSELREAVAAVNTFYSDNVVFEGNLAACPWEAGMNLGTCTTDDNRPVPEIAEGIEPYCVASMSAPSQFTNQPSVIDTRTSAQEEEIGWDGEVSEYELRQDEREYGGPVHSSYGYSDRSSLDSDPASPITPTNDFSEGGRACSFVDWDTYRIYDREEEQYHGQRPNVFASVTRSTFDDDDDDESHYAASAFIATPVGEKPFFQPSGRVPADGFRTAKRYSSPNTSIYSVAEVSVFEDDSDVDETPPPPRKHRQAREPDPASPESMVFVNWPPETHPRGSRPITVPRSSKPKSHIFNPMRFLPRSAGTSWLNTKTPSPANHPPAPSSTRVRQAEARPVPAIPWDDYNRAYIRQHPNMGGRAPARSANIGGFSGHVRPSREWIPTLFTGAG